MPANYTGNPGNAAYELGTPPTISRPADSDVPNVESVNPAFGVLADYIARIQRMLASATVASMRPEATGYTDNLYGVAFNYQVLCAVGANSRIITSRDGIGWVARTAPWSGAVFRGVAPYTAEGFIAVTDQAGIARSTDGGVTWAGAAGTAGTDYKAVAGSGSSGYVIAGITSNYPAVWESATGSSSFNTTAPLPGGTSGHTLRAVGWNDAGGGIHRWIVGGTGGNIWRSTDRVTWTKATTTGFTTEVRSIHYSPARARWFASGTGGYAYSTDDGATWTAGTPYGGVAMAGMDNLVVMIDNRNASIPWPDAEDHLNGVGGFPQPGGTPSHWINALTVAGSDPYYLVGVGDSGTCVRSSFILYLP